MVCYDVLSPDDVQDDYDAPSQYAFPVYSGLYYLHDVQDASDALFHHDAPDADVARYPRSDFDCLCSYSFYYRRA